MRLDSEDGGESLVCEGGGTNVEDGKMNLECQDGAMH